MAKLTKQPAASLMTAAANNQPLTGQLDVDTSGKSRTPVSVTPQEFIFAVHKETPTKTGALNQALANIDKNFGKGSVVKMGDKPILDIEVISTGCLSLDIALGVMGIPRGRVVEIFGPEASGKTTLCLQLAATVHKNGGNVAIIDAEHALDMKYAKNLGVNVNELYLSQPECGEVALGIAEEWIRSGVMDLVVIDSVAALTPRSEIEGEMGDPQMGAHARLMSQALRKLTSIVSKSGTTVIFTNQLRQKIGVIFGNPETTTGGNALKFYASIRLDIRRIEAIKDGTNIVGNRTRIKVVKNKVAPPFKDTEVSIFYGRGIDRLADIISLGIQYGVIQQSGSWFSYKEDRIGQGKDAVAMFLKTNPTILTDIENAIKVAVTV